MSPSDLKWWKERVLIGAGFFVVGVITGPMAHQHGYGTFAGLIVTILAWIACSVCWVVGLIRFVKWVWSMRISN